jgi:hypothetical protein
LACAARDGVTVAGASNPLHQMLTVNAGGVGTGRMRLFAVAKNQSVV